MSPGHACEIERLHGEWQEAMCVWDMDLRCSLSIFPAQSHHFHRFAEFSLCCDAMSNRASHWGLATCAVTFGHVLRLSPVRASPCGKAALQRLSTACRDLGRLPSSSRFYLVRACSAPGAGSFRMWNSRSDPPSAEMWSVEGRIWEL